LTRNVIEAIGVGKRYRRQPGKNNLPTLRETMARRWSEWFGHKLHVMHSGLGKEDFWALRGVDFKVKEGEVVGLIGRNGAGKSTLLKILSRICEPTEGSIKIRGRVGALLEVGTGFHPELTGRENVYLNGAVLGLRRDEIRSRFDSIVDFSGVERFLDTPVKHYSSGMQARLGFAVAAHLEPEVLIVDEVLAVGDAVFQRKCLGKMRDAAGEGRTVLYVSHNLASLSTLCSRGLVLDNGKVSFDGSIHGAVSSYLNGAFPLEHEISQIRQRGMREFLIKEIKIKGHFGDYVNVIRHGENCEIRFYFENGINEPLSDIILGILITNDLGVVVINVNSLMTGDAVNDFSSKGYVTLKFLKIALVPGVYHFKFTINSAQGIVRQIHSGFFINVIDGDFYGVGKGCAAKEAIYMPHCEWMVNDHGI